MKMPPIELATIVSLPFEENSYVLWLPGRSDCLVVDPGLEPDKIIDELQRRRLTPAAILNTHGHSDHIAGNRDVKERWPDCPLVIGAGDAAKLTDAWQNLSAMFGVEITSPAADRLVREGDVVSAAGFELAVHEIPGHSSGHVVFVCRGLSPLVVLGGDVLFAGSVGRTDFPDGDFDALRDGIHQKLFTLPDDTVVLSGHGPPTTIGREKQGNPYVGRPAGYRFY
jgi:glyoxylase-like metal-dependent hydrolase (beta-lactamase superfamily II)